jgi:iron complex outermembrane receptor protein
MAASVQVIDGDQITSSGAHDLPSLLKKKAGMGVRAMNSNPILTSLAMRGFGENAHGRIKVVLDGEELNNVDMNAPNLTRIPIGSVERVEVIHGPNPVLYGDGAIAGIVNVTTDTHDYEPLTKITGKIGSQYTYGGNVQTKGGDEKEGVLYNASYDYLQSDGYRKHSAFDIHTANSGVRKNFENGSTIGLKINYQNAFYELPGSLTKYEWKNGRKTASTPEDWARIWSYGAVLDSKIKIAEDQWFYLDGGFSKQYRHAVYRATTGESDYEYDYYSCHMSPRYVNECEFIDYENKFTIGLDFRYDLFKENHVSYGAPIKRHFNRDRYSAFVYDEFFFTDELSIVSGARFERIGNRWRRYIGLSETRSHDWMGDYEIGIVYRPVEGLKTYIKGTRFHRSPFCDELSYTQNGDFLEPETGESLDMGLEWKFAEEFTFMFNGYGMIMEDEIFFDPALLPWGYNSNSPAKTRRIGFDTELSWQRDKFAEASIRYNIVHADFSSGEYHGKDVPYVPNHQIRFEGGFWIVEELKVKGGYTYTSSQYVSGDYANVYEELPAYSLFDVGVYYEPSWAEGWSASFVVDNLFDRNYCDYAGPGYYYPACGRSFMFTLSYEF